MIIRPAIARLYWACSKFRFVKATHPYEDAGVLLGVPHTSNWDFIVMLGIAWREGMRPQFLGKKELFRGPMGPLMRALGGIEVDRANPGTLVADLVERAKAGESFHLVITPEGTRSEKSVWKSGFYRIALDAGLPVTLGYVDTVTKTAGLGPTFRLTGDVTADMDRVREFYAGMKGVTGRPTNPVLAQERSGTDEPGPVE